MTQYAPGTQEKDHTKQNMALQQHASSIDANTATIATNTTAITANTAAIAANTTSIASNTAAITSLSTTLGGITSGQLQFPATQNPSSNVNTLDDYEEGNWTPVLTFATPGNLAITYLFQNGYYTKIGRLVAVNFIIVTSAYTFTTASGNMLVNGLPFASVNDANYRAYSPVIFQGINKASYTDVFGVIVGNVTQFQIFASGMGQVVANVTTADAPTAGTVAIGGSVTYVTAT